MKKFTQRAASKLPIFSSRRQKKDDDVVEEVSPDQVQIKGRSDRWSDHQKETLITIVQEQNQLGNVVNGNPTSLIWNEITVTFNHRLHLTRTSQQLKDAWKNLKRDYRRYYDLANKSDWGWNYELGLPEATDDVWEELLHANPGYKLLRHRPFPFYGMFEDITQNTFAMGHHSRGTVDLGGNETHSPPAHVNVEGRASVSFAPDYVFIDEHNTVEQTVGASSPSYPTPGTSSKKRSSTEGSEAEPATTSKRRQKDKNVKLKILEQMERREAYTKQMVEHTNPFSYKESLEKLNEIPNLTSDGYVALMYILRRNPDMRTGFMMASGPNLRGWIDYIIRLDDRWNLVIIWLD